MLVVTQVSSRKIRRPGVSSACLSRHAVRASATSARPCSAAWSVFFSRQAQRLEKAADRRAANLNALQSQLLMQLIKRDVRLRGQQRMNRTRMASERVGLLPADRSWHHAPGSLPALHQLDRATLAHRELMGRRSP